MDFDEGLPKSNDKDITLVVVDRFTKYAHFLPLKHPFTAKEVINLFTDNIFKLHALPTVIVTDRDRVFTSQIWQALFTSLEIKLHYSTSYHPETDGQTERVNRCPQKITIDICGSQHPQSGITGCLLPNVVV